MPVGKACYHPRHLVSLTMFTKYDKVRQSVTVQKQSKKHGPITSSDQTVPTQIRACDWSMPFAFALPCNTLTHFVILYGHTK